MMEKVLLIVLVPIFFTISECKNTRTFRRKAISNEILDDDETCSKGKKSWMEFPSAFMQNAMDSIFSSRSQSRTEPKFLCFSRQNGQEPDDVSNPHFTSWDMNKCDSDSTIKTIFIIHGFKDSYAPWTREMKDALILREDCKVFIVEYGQQSTTYSELLKYIPDIGKQVAIFIRNLMKSKNLDPQHVHIIGHSMGAQVAGFAGKEIQNTEKKSVGRITGLDPAGPGFYGATLDQRLDPTDASFVDIIHTNRGCNRLQGMGYSDPSGHFDFYPNGGQIQPGCLTLSQLLGKMDFPLAKASFNFLFGMLEQTEKQILNYNFCSHLRAHEFFTASILNGGCKFISVQCSSWKDYVSGQCNGNGNVVMGYDADGYKDIAENGIHKKFYLETTTDFPFCRQ